MVKIRQIPDSGLFDRISLPDLPLSMVHVLAFVVAWNLPADSLLCGICLDGVSFCFQLFQPGLLGGKFGLQCCFLLLLLL